MTVETVRDALGWCCVINFAVLFVWFTGFMVARNWMFKVHGKWFKLSQEQFDAIHYAGLGLFKMSIVLFNLAPYLALRIAG